MKKSLLFASLLFAGSSMAQIFSENFESVSTPALPNGWTQVTNATDGGYQTSTDLTSQYFQFPSHTTYVGTNDDDCNCDKADEQLISPAISIPAGEAYSVTFEYILGAYYGEWAEFGVSTDGGSTFTSLVTLDPTNGSGSHVWTEASISLSAYAGQTIHLMWNYNDNADWGSGLVVDDVSVDPLPANEAAITAMPLDRYVMIGAEMPVVATIQNNGGNAISGMQIDVNVNGTVTPFYYTGSIASGASENITLTSIGLYQVEEKMVTATIVSVNGGSDSDNSDNEMSADVHSLYYAPAKTVVIEEGTGTWCGWCPRGAVAMDYMTATYPNDFVGIAVHNGDPMTVAAYDAAANFSGYPSANVDRAVLDGSVSQAAFEQYYNDRKDLLVPAQVGLTETVNGNDITVVASAVFHTEFTAANFRLAVIMVEDNVTGSTSGYNQTNYYSGGGQGAMGGYESLPDPVPAAQMVYDHVGRALLGGYNGQAGSVPAVITDGTTATYTFNYTVPAEQDVNEMHPVAVLIDQNTGEIVNAGTSAVDGSLSIATVEKVAVDVYPNPASDVVNVAFEANGDYTVVITDMQGRVVMTKSFSNLVGQQSIELGVGSLNAGNYMVSVGTEGTSTTKMIAIK